MDWLQQALRAAVMMGDTLGASAATVTARWNHIPDDSSIVRLIVDGQVDDERIAGRSGEASWALDGARWCAVELRDASGTLWALTNPIFFSAE